MATRSDIGIFEEKNVDFFSFVYLIIKKYQLHGYIPQRLYREGNAYIIKNPMVCLMGPIAKFL